MTTLRAEFKKDWAVLPNLFTEARLVLSPLAAILFLCGPKTLYVAAMTAFFIVAATDKIDGYLARRLNKVTVLGTMLDPIVDKILVVTTLVALSIVYPLVWVPTLIIFTREISVFLLLLRVRRRGEKIAVIYSGKVKTVVQSAAVFLLFMPLSGVGQQLVWAVVGAAVALTLTSWIDYLNAYRDAKGKE